jgi:uncharacterized protein YggE
VERRVNRRADAAWLPVSDYEKMEEIQSLGEVMRHAPLYALLFAVISSAGPAEAEANQIEVSGSAAVLVQPDFASVDIGVLSSDPVASAALKANSEKMARVVAAIKALGISETALQTSNFSIAAVHPKIGNSYEDDDTRTVAYKVTNKLSVHITDMGKVGDVIDAAIDAGANSSNSVAFGVKDRASYADKALAEAVKDAHHRAEVMAATENVKVGRVLSMSTEQDISAEDIGRLETVVVTGSRTPILSGQLPVQAKVVVTYALE